MPIKRVVLVALSLASILVMARAEGGMNIDEAVAKAAKSNASLGREALDLAAAKRAADAAQSLLYPSASVSGGLSRAGGFPGSLAAELDNYSLYADLSLSISLSPATRIKMERLGLVYGKQLLSYKAASRALELEVRSSFYAILLDQANLALAEQNLEREKKSCDKVRTKFSAGLVPELDYLQAQVGLAEMEPKAESARVSLEDDLDSFRLLLGLEPGSPLELRGSLETAKNVTIKAVSDIVGKEKGESLSAAAIRKSMEIATLDRKLAALNIASPSLSLSAKLMPVLGGLGSGVSVSGSTGSFSAVVSYPLSGYLPSSAESVALAAADDEIASLQSQLDEARRASKVSVDGYLRAIKAATTSLAALGGNVELARKTYDLTSQAYEKGLKDLSDIETAAGSLDSANADFVAEEHTLLAKVLGLESELGLDFGTIGRN
jgi:outer membrane protein TolC